MAEIITDRRRRQASDSEYTKEEHQHEDEVQRSDVGDEPLNDGAEDISSGSEYTEDSEDESVAEGERNPADGESPHEDTLDDDEDVKNPAFIPRKGLFYEHDSRSAEADDFADSQGSAGGVKGDQENDERLNPKSKKLWDMEKKDKWGHDFFDEKSQAPKSREELIALYGYDIRSKDTPPENPPQAYNARRGRRGRGRSFFGDYANSSRPYRGGRGGRGRGYRSRYYDNNSTGANQDRSNSVAASQDVRSQDVRSQDVRSQDVRSQSVKSQDVRLNPTSAEAVTSKSDGRLTVAHKQGKTNDALSTKSPPNQNKGDDSSSCAVPKRYSSQRQSSTTTSGKPTQDPPLPRPLLGQQHPPAQQQRTGGPGGVGNPPPGQPPQQTQQTPCYTAVPVVNPQMYVNQGANHHMRMMPQPSRFVSPTTPGAHMPQQVPSQIVPPGMQQPPVRPVMSQGVVPPIMNYVPNSVISNQSITGQPVSSSNIPAPSPQQQFPAGAQLGPPQLQQVPVTSPAVTEPGVAIRGAVYYQPSQQRPVGMEASFYPALTSSNAENTGATYFSQQTPLPPSQHPFSAGSTPPADKQGPVYYNTQAQQTGKPSPQSKPRVKNVIPIVDPQVTKSADTLNLYSGDCIVHTNAEQQVTPGNVNHSVTSTEMQNSDCPVSTESSISPSPPEQLNSRVIKNNHLVAQTEPIATVDSISNPIIEHIVNAAANEPIIEPLTDVHANETINIPAKDTSGHVTSTSEPISGHVTSTSEPISGHVTSTSEPISEHVTSTSGHVTETNVTDTGANENIAATSTLLTKIRDEAAGPGTGCNSIQSDDLGDHQPETIISMSVPYDVEEAHRGSSGVSVVDDTSQLEKPHEQEIQLVDSTLSDAPEALEADTWYNKELQAEDEKEKPVAEKANVPINTKVPSFEPKDSADLVSDMPGPAGDSGVNHKAPSSAPTSD